VTEQGQPLSEELTLVLAARIRLARTPGTVVTNISTTGALEQVAGRYQSNVVRTPVGQAYISEAMLEHRAVLGGEGSGGVTVPQVQLSHDSAATIGLILEGLAKSRQRISAIANDLPQLVMMKRNVPVEPHLLYSVLQNFRVDVEGENLAYDLTDGIRVVLPEGWVHVRASNTESLIRIIVEAKDEVEAQNLIDWTRDRLNR
jgi:phosphomannomutase